MGGFGVLAALFGFVYILKTLPAPELLENRQVSQSTKIYDRTGEVLLFEIHGEEKRTIIPFEEIPEIVKKSTLAVEDINFYQHAALDWKSIARAFFVNLRRTRVVQGGSTITQQLAKKAFLSDARTFSRKIRELILAIQLERRFTKDQILEAYLNQIPYGSNAYGIEAASQVFFEKSAKDLALGEAALLASLPKAPTFYSPWGQNTEALSARWKNTLEKMYSARFISGLEKEGALEKALQFAKPYKGIKAPHFVITVQDYLNKQYGENFIRTNGLRVITTLDWELQQLAERVVAAGAERNERLYEGKNSALVAQDSNTGQILALVGSRDYFDTENEGNFNVPVQGLRQPGSAIKPFIYATAFKKGYTPDTVVFDLETEFDTTHDPEKSYKPVDFDEKFRGPITFRNALAQSVNIPAVKVLYLVGINEALKTAREFGLTTLTEKSRYGLSLVLGGGEVKLIDLVNAYSVFAEDGVKRQQSFILKITTAKNTILEEYKNQEEQIIEPQYARLINDILSDNEARLPLYGPSGLTIPGFPDHQIAVKTGTSNDYRDAWTVGYTPSLVVGVWSGNNNNKPMVKKGSSILAAVPIWKEFMKEALKKVPAEVFNKPDQIFVQKPVLNGNYIVNYKSSDLVYPQIHEILFYVDKSNPLGPEPTNPEGDIQFVNWEKPVIDWATKNIPEFTTKFNQLLPVNSSVFVEGDIDFSNKLELTINKPKSGASVSNLLELEAKIVSANLNIDKIELYFNGVLVGSKTDNLGKDFIYTAAIGLSNVELQNLFKFVVFDEKNNRTEKDIILFKQS